MNVQSFLDQLEVNYRLVRHQPAFTAQDLAQVEHIPGRASPHQVVVHPTPNQFVAAVWKSPVDGGVFVAARIAHAHPACGNGVAWFLEHRRGDRATVLAEGLVAGPILIVPVAIDDHSGRERDDTAPGTSRLELGCPIHPEGVLASELPEVLRPGSLGLFGREECHHREEERWL